MSIYFEKARELGMLIIESEQSKAVADATATFAANEEAQVKLSEYQMYQTNVQQAMSGGAAAKEEVEIMTKKLTEMAIELKQDPIIGAIVFAENEFNAFVNQIMNVLKATITGQGEAEPSGGCSSCGTGECGSCN